MKNDPSPKKQSNSQIPELGYQVEEVDQCSEYSGESELQVHFALLKARSSEKFVSNEIKCIITVC